MRFNAGAFMLGVAYERLVNRFAALANFRHLILGRARKPTATGQTSN